jgi:hypothetical protein
MDARLQVIERMEGYGEDAWVEAHGIGVGTVWPATAHGKQFPVPAMMSTQCLINANCGGLPSERIRIVALDRQPLDRSISGVLFVLAT